MTQIHRDLDPKEGEHSEDLAARNFQLHLNDPSVGIDETFEVASNTISQLVSQIKELRGELICEKRRVARLEENLCGYSGSGGGNE